MSSTFSLEKHLVFTSISRTGSLMATTCKDKKLRIIDPRSSEVLRVGNSHQGNKASKVRLYEVFLTASLNGESYKFVEVLS